MDEANDNPFAPPGSPTGPVPAGAGPFAAPQPPPYAPWPGPVPPPTPWGVPSPYPSTAPSWLFGLVGAVVQSQHAERRGLPDTGRYWRAAAVSTTVVLGLALLALVGVASARSTGAPQVVLDAPPDATAPEVPGDGPAPVDCGTASDVLDEVQGVVGAALTTDGSVTGFQEREAAVEDTMTGAALAAYRARAALLERYIYVYGGRQTFDPSGAVLVAGSCDTPTYEVRGELGTADVPSVPGPVNEAVRVTFRWDGDHYVVTRLQLVGLLAGALPTG